MLLYDYGRLNRLVTETEPVTRYARLRKAAVLYLVDFWLSDYSKTTQNSKVVEVRVNDFSYLFDVVNERLIAAWGISKGKHDGPRPKSRMQGHPLSDGPLYHRGHAIPHSLGGPLDINLVAQRGSVNIGPFRHLEIKAANTPGALYFSYWKYDKPSEQRPFWIEQGFIYPGKTEIAYFHN